MNENASGCTAVAPPVPAAGCDENEKPPVPAVVVVPPVVVGVLNEKGDAVVAVSFFSPSFFGPNEKVGAAAVVAAGVDDVELASVVVVGLLNEKSDEDGAADVVVVG